MSAGTPGRGAGPAQGANARLTTEELDVLDETHDVLADQHLLAEMKQAQTDLDAGLGVELDALPPRA